MKRRQNALTNVLRRSVESARRTNTRTVRRLRVPGSWVKRRLAGPRRPGQPSHFSELMERSIS